jgi:hypothetical protein
VAEAVLVIQQQVQMLLQTMAVMVVQVVVVEAQPQH